jgi:ATP-dependent DNA ligase
MTKQWPKLYKKSPSETIQEWEISVTDNNITVSHGQLGGKIQTGVETIKEGKNAGKSNATTPEEQAVAEAESKFQKSLKKGYCKSLEDCQNGILDDVIEGGIAPMLAPSDLYPTFAYKLTLPVITQPKIDGGRMIYTDEKLWSRTRKRKHCLPHIIDAIQEQLGVDVCDLDGEAWSEEIALREGFQGMMSYFNQDNPLPKCKDMGYYIYDLPSSKKNNFERDKERLELLKNVKWPLVAIKSTVCNNEAEVWAQQKKNLAAGYEGTMIRGDGPYEIGVRSYYLQKLKEFEDHEFEIVGVEEGKGKCAGTAAKFVCKTSNGLEFRCSLSDVKREYLKELFERPEGWWAGLSMTVKHQGWFKSGKPRQPIGKALRRGEE